MPGLAPEVKALLQERFGPRVNFEERERRIYANDMGVMPSMVKPLVGNPVPDGIVQPVSEEELVWLVGLAHERGIPLTPRGKG
ncbi:MAG: hypothetical protein QHH05_08210, partial [Syntrophomonadaceae bacterium]|nr:hypothetical protein [Syntrophomonadaceae bacterium]